MKNDFGRYLLYDDNYRAGCGLCGWRAAFATLYGFLDGGSLNVRKYSFYVNFQSSGSSTFPQHKKESLSFSMHIQAVSIMNVSFCCIQYGVKKKKKQQYDEHTAFYWLQSPLVLSKQEAKAMRFCGFSRKPNKQQKVFLF